MDNREPCHLCTCYNVSESEIRQIIQSGAGTVKDVFEKMGGTVSCDDCVWPIRNMLEVKPKCQHVTEFLQAYEEHSVILTSNKPFQEWSGLFDDATVVSAILDRLLHHVHLFNMEGDSYRLKDLNESQNQGGDRVS